METKNYDNKFNICIVGNNNVGKSSYIKRLIDDTFVCTYKKTSGIETFHIPKNLNKKNYLFKIWDICGNTKPLNISNDLYRTVDAFIFTFAFNDPDSLEDIKYWVDSIVAKNISLENCIMLCLKTDLESDSSNINLQNAKKTCEDYEIEFFEISAKSNINVNVSFDRLVQKILYTNSNSTNYVSVGSIESNESQSGCHIF